MSLFKLALTLVLLAMPALCSAQAVCKDPAVASASGKANAVVVATLPAKPNRVIYLHTIDIQMAATGPVTGAAGPAPIFTTSVLMGGASLVWWGDSADAPQGTQKQIVRALFSPSVLRTPNLGQALTVTSDGSGRPTQNVIINITGCYGG